MPNGRLLTVAAFACVTLSCSDPTEPSNPAAVGTPVFTWCQGWKGAPATGSVVVDLYFHGDGPPTAAQESLVIEHGGRILHRYQVPVIRAQVPADALPAVFEADLSTRTRPNHARSVPDRRAAAVDLVILFERTVLPGDLELVESLNGRMTHVFQLVTGLAAEVPDAALPSLRAWDGVTAIELNQIGCGLSPTHLDPTSGEAVDRTVGMDAVPGLRSEDGAEVQVQHDPPWGLDRIDQRDLPLDGRYVYDRTGAGATVFLLDSGLRLQHQEFQGEGGGRATHGVSFVDDGGGPDDCSGSGTHLGGTIAGSTYGVAKEARLVSVRILDCHGETAVVDWLRALEWVASQVVSRSVVHMSTAIPAHKAIDEASAALFPLGVVVVSGAGDLRREACDYSPGRVPQVINVAATTEMDTPSTHTNRGTCVDLFAPGENIISAGHTSDEDSRVEGGSSFLAAAHVTGIVAAYRGAFGHHSPPVVVEAVLQNATTDRLTGTDPASPNLLSYSMPPEPDS